jgi:hypothetical protein
MNFQTHDLRRIGFEKILTLLSAARSLGSRDSARCLPWCDERKAAVEESDCDNQQALHSTLEAESSAGNPKRANTSTDLAIEARASG